VKKIIFLFALALSSLHAGSKVVTLNDSPRIVSAADLSFEKIQELIQSKSSDIAIVFNEGAAFPLRFLVRNRVLSTMLDPNLTFKVEKTCYLRVIKKHCYMSEDLIHWQKASKFMEGNEVTINLTPSPDKPGFVLQAEIVP
jgi:hypothetical protein